MSLEKNRSRYLIAGKNVLGTAEKSKELEPTQGARNRAASTANRDIKGLQSAATATHGGILVARITNV